jgi:hypothetical protein
MLLDDNRICNPFSRCFLMARIPQAEIERLKKEVKPGTGEDF